MSLSLASLALGLTLALQPGPPVGLGEPPALKADETPEKLENVGIEEKLGAAVPAQTPLTTYDGRQVSLGDVLSHDKPTILTFNYSDCPMLCSIQLNALTRTLREMDWTLGEEYDVVTISIDPKETPDRAADTRDRYLAQYDREHADGAWTFLVPNDEKNVRAVSDTVGFNYELNEDNGEWAHTAVAVILSGDDTVSRYLYGIDFSPRTLQLSLTEASQGKQVSAVDSLVLYCFQYDPNSGSYTPVIVNIMRLGGALIALIVFAFVLRTVLREQYDRGDDGDHDTPRAPEPDRSPST